MPDSQPCVLIVDDDRVFCQAVEDLLSGEGHAVFSAHTGAAALELCAGRRVDLVLLDQKLPDGEGVDFCPRILGLCEQAKIIFITAYPEFSHAVRAMQAGAYDYLAKPCELEELELSVARALRARELERAGELRDYREAKEREGAVLIGSGPALTDVRRMVRLAAGNDAPVLLTGETGTGKNVVARTIHYQGRGEGKGAFIAVNCAALPESLIEAELFGHEKGVFTGAGTSRKGLFEMADGGTLFLDEIGEIPLHLQSKLLGVLEEGAVRRIGGSAPRPVNVRIVAATNARLEEAVSRGRFREDLFYRLNVLRIELPPLRSRPEDLPELVAHFLSASVRGNPVRLPEVEMERLVAYAWPGNIRELRNVLERALLLAPGETVYPSALLGGAKAPGEPAPTSFEPLPLAEVEKEHIRLSLESFGGNYTRTARALGIALSTLKRKVREYDLRAEGSK